MISWWRNRVWLSRRSPWRHAAPIALAPPEPVRIGLSLGGGFARGLAHVGVLRVLDRHRIPIHCITGVSAGAIAAAAYASGATPDEIGAAGAAMRFADVARWSFCRLGLVASGRMERFLRRLLKRYRFEEMALPLGVVATDVVTGEPVLFYGQGGVFVPIRASCAYPGLFQPVPWQDRLLVDGAMSMEVPASLARALGANRVISVHLPAQGRTAKPSNMFQVVNLCFQIMQARTEDGWKADSDLVIQPDVRGVEWDGFESALPMIEAGERAALEALPQIRALLEPPGRAVEAAGRGAALIPDSKPA